MYTRNNLTKSKNLIMTDVEKCGVCAAEFQLLKVLSTVLARLLTGNRVTKCNLYFEQVHISCLFTQSLYN